jgi:uncharacterized membrane protein YkvI
MRNFQKDKDKKDKDGTKIIKVASVFTGLIFGAGFASGQEHLTFFLRYGRFGIYGFVLAGLVLGFCGWAVLSICVRENIKDYKGFMLAVFGPRLGGVLDVITGLFIFVIFSAMLAGAGAMGEQAFNLPFSVGVILTAMLCFVILLFDFRGIVEINTVATPILIAGALFLGIYAIVNANIPTAFNSQFSILNSKLFLTAAISALIYASYNMITAIAVLSAMPQVVTNQKIARAGGLLGGFFVLLVGLVFAFALQENLPLVRNAELPMMALSQIFSPIIAHGYTILLFTAIFTTAATNAFGLTSRLAARTKTFTKLQIKIAVTIAAAFAAHMGFANMVSRAYTVFGFLGLFIVVAVLLRQILRVK